MDRIRTLLLTGANNHDWRRSAPFCRDLLEGTGRFAVTLTETPGEALADPAVARDYDLFFVDYNGPRWGDAAERSFVAAVNAGAGVVILHAADNAFPGWYEYERMCALCWREGTGHGQVHEFDVRVLDPDHAITKGLLGFKQIDELYHQLVHMHDAPYEVLATAWSDPAKGGTGRDEPVMITTRYGQGRIFHQILGHLWDGDPAHVGSTFAALEGAGFRRSTLRGAEWAATGAVTQA